MADKFVKLAQLGTFLKKLKNIFVQKDGSKVLSDNNYTTAEKNKLAGIAANANAYTLPIASSTALGGVKIGSNLAIDTDGTLSAVQKDVDLTPYAKKATTLAGYGITDAKIVNGVITLGGTSITPLTTHQSLSAYALKTSIPTKTSQLTNDSGFVVSSTLDNYALKSDVASAVIYKGSVENYSDLPKTGMLVGWMYNIQNADTEHGISAGDNVVYNGKDWDNYNGTIVINSATDTDIDGLFA